MQLDESIFAAPWGKALKVMSFWITVLLAVLAGVTALPFQSALLLFILLLLALPFMVHGYAVERDRHADHQAAGLECRVFVGGAAVRGGPAP